MLCNANHKNKNKPKKKKRQRRMVTKSREMKHKNHIRKTQFN